MHLNKNIEKLSELKDLFCDGENAGDTFIDMLKAISYGPLTREINAIKKKGYNAGELLSVLLLLPFAGISSVRALYYSGLAWMSDAGKDSYYRLKNEEMVNWRKILGLVVRRFKAIVSEKGDAHEGTPCMVLDDTFLEKTSSSTEGVSRVFDHVSKTYVLGYKLLLLGWWDGKSFVPVDFSLHREGSNKDKDRFGLKRKQRKVQYIPFSYVLTDSWFFCERLLQYVRKLKKGGVHLISMARMGKAKYEHENKEYTPKELNRKLKGKRKRCRKLRAEYASCTAHYKGVAVKLFFVRYRGQEDWKLMVTTDRSLSFVDMMETYHIRWSIEVCFKEAKQYLRLGKGQSQDLDAQIADATISMIQYSLLSLSKRFEEYETLGGMFRDQQQEALSWTLVERIRGLFREVVGELCEALGMSQEELMERLLDHDHSAKLEKIVAFWCQEREEEQQRTAA